MMRAARGMFSRGPCDGGVLTPRARPPAVASVPTRCSPCLVQTQPGGALQPRVLNGTVPELPSAEVDHPANPEDLPTPACGDD